MMDVIVLAALVPIMATLAKCTAGFGSGVVLSC